MNIKKLAEKVPHTYVLLFLIILFAGFLTYVIPAGEYNRVEINGRLAVEPGTFHRIEQQPVGIFKIFQSFQLGIISASNIVAFVFIIGGSVGILRATKAIDAVLIRVIQKFRGTGNEKLILIGTTIFFSLLGGIIGLYEEALGFMPFAVMIAISLGYDAVVGISIGLLGLAAGFAAAPLNPFTVGIAQGIAELPLFSGMWFRWVFFIISVGATIWYILRYGKKVKNDPTQSYVSDIDYSDMKMDEDPSEIKFTPARKRVIAVFIISLVVLIYGVLKFDWYINELSGLFFAMGIFSGIVYGMSPNEMGEQFVEGAKYLLYGALLIGVARGIMVMLEDGMILDTVIYYMVQPLYNLPAYIASSLMVIIQTFINFFVPSGSGQAMVTMPIMAPIADLIGINRQVAVLAFQYGDGFSNMFIPTLGATMACLGIARIDYGRWIAYVWKLLVIQLLIGISAVITATLIGLGPF
ncbi:MAG: YfcC family protein [bacterium]